MNAEPERRHTDLKCDNVILERNLLCANTDYKRGTYQKASCKDNTEHDNPVLEFNQLTSCSMEVAREIH